MKTRLGRLAASMVSLTVACAAVTACDSGSSDSVDTSQNRQGAMASYAEGQQFKATEPVTFTTLFLDQPNYPYKNDWLFWSELTKRTNVTLQPTIVPYKDYEQKRSLLVSSGEAPMIIPKTYPGQENAFVSSGAILPVSDYVNLMPNFQAKIKKWHLEPEIDLLRQEDGKFYLLPGLHEAVWPNYTVAMRTDLLAQQNIPVPATWQELESALKRLKQAYPDKIPFSDRYEGKALLQMVASSYGTVGGRNWSYIDGLQFDDKSGKFQLAATTDAYKGVVEYLHGLIAQGLLDSESFTQKDDQATRKFVTGQSLAISGNYTHFSEYRKTMDETLGKDKYTIARIPVPGGPMGQVMGGLGASRLESGIMINSKAKQDPHFVAMMQFIDWLWYSDEGQVFAKWGIEGTTYTKSGDKFTLTPDVKFGGAGLNPAGTKDLRVDYGFSGGVFSYGGSTALLRSTMTPEEVAWQDQMAKTHKQLKPNPPYPFNDAEREQATLLLTPLNDFVEQNTLKFITGQRPLSEWNAFVQEFKGKGADTYLGLVNTAHDRYVQKNGGR